MKFRFPVVIIDEDFRSENISGSGIRALAEAIQGEGVEVLGLTSYGDLTSFAQQSSRASCFILSIDDDELLPYVDNVVVAEGDTPELASAIVALRAFVQAVRRRNADIPIFLYGETRTSRHLPNDILRELHGFITCSRTRRSSSRATSFARRRSTSTHWRRRSSRNSCSTR